MNLTILRHVGQAFYRMFLNWNLSKAFLWIYLRLWLFLEEDHGGKVPFSLPSQGIIPSTWVTSVDVDPNHLTKVVFVRLLQLKLTLFSLSILDSLEGRVTMLSPYLGSRNLSPPPWGQSICIQYLVWEPFLSYKNLGGFHKSKVLSGGMREKMRKSIGVRQEVRNSR